MWYILSVSGRIRSPYKLQDFSSNVIVGGLKKDHAPIVAMVTL